MRERPILFSAQMVRAILAGHKTQTRRVMKPQPAMVGPTLSCWRGFAIESGDRPGIWCPYGVPGDRLVFLCTWAAPKEFDKVKPSSLPRTVRIWTLFDGTEKPAGYGKSRPGRFMPLWMRGRMPRGELTAVRVQRVQEITPEDAQAEGVPSGLSGDAGAPLCSSYIDNFRDLWDSINGERPGCAWAANPWVWALGFRRVEA